MTDLWARVEPLLAHVERPARYIDREWGARRAPADYRVALIYPDTYELGMANQAVAILYDILNGEGSGCGGGGTATGNVDAAGAGMGVTGAASPRGALDGVSAERAFVPWRDMAARMREAGVPLFTLESCAPVRECDLVGITLPCEITYTNVLEALDLAGIPLRAADRGDDDPLVIGGGPGALNPEPMAPFFDALLIGEGEDAIFDIVATHRRTLADGATREQTLRSLAAVPGLYVPSLYAPATDSSPATPLEGSGAPHVVAKRVLASLSTHRTPPCPVVPFMDVVHDRANVEVLRGCTRGCRFCQAGMVHRPVRERTADEIVRDALTQLRCTGQEEVSLTSLSTTDHSQLSEVLRRLSAQLAGAGVAVSLPSLRVDPSGVDLARMASSGRKSGLTFAPEAGTQRLRDVINKNVTEEQLADTIRAAFSSGWRRLKLYYMVGLPTETDEDVRGIGEMVARMLEVARDAVTLHERGNVRMSVSASVFVPKAHTPFQWEGQLSVAEVRRRQAILRDATPRKGVDLSWHDADTSLLEGALARAGRRVADVIERAWRAGAVFEAWSEEFELSRWTDAFAAEGLDAEELASLAPDPDAPLPWDHISVGVDRAYLLAERERAIAARTTADCSFDSCTSCGVCSSLDVDVVLGGERCG